MTWRAWRILASPEAKHKRSQGVWQTKYGTCSCWDSLFYTRSHEIRFLNWIQSQRDYLKHFFFSFFLFLYLLLQFTFYFIFVVWYLQTFRQTAFWEDSFLQGCGLFCLHFRVDLHRQTKRPNEGYRMVACMTTWRCPTERGKPERKASRSVSRL